MVKENKEEATDSEAVRKREELFESEAALESEEVFENELVFDRSNKRPDDDVDISARSSNSKIHQYTVRKTSSVVSTNSGTTQKKVADGRQDRDKKVVGMTSALRTESGTFAEQESVEEAERKARDSVAVNPFYLAVTGNYASMKVFLLYLVTIDTLFSCFATVGLTIFWYYLKKDRADEWSADELSWSLLGFAVVLPMSRSISFAFTRREKALHRIAQFRSFSYHIYLAHANWNWGTDNCGRDEANVDWLKHTDKVLVQLIGIGDELCRFLSLPTSTGTRHRIMASGYEEAAQLMQVSYRLFDSFATRRMTKLTKLVEPLRAKGLSSTECSRIRQFERYLCETFESLRQIKMYRTPQALRSFARIFTVILPPFYAPSFAQMAIDLESLGMAICMAVIATLALTALFESIQVLEDPFVAFVTLDGIDIREELEVLHYQQLVNARGMMYPDADEFPEQNLAALTPENSNDLELDGDQDGEASRHRRSSGRRSSAMMEKSLSFRAATARPPLDRRVSAYQVKGNRSSDELHGSSSSTAIGKRELTVTSKKWADVKVKMHAIRALNTNGP